MRKACPARRMFAVGVGTPLAALFGFVFSLWRWDFQWEGPGVTAGLFLCDACLFPHPFDTSCTARLQLVILLRALLCGMISGILGLWMYFFPAR